jgi:hypothetical protein
MVPKLNGILVTVVSSGGGKTIQFAARRVPGAREAGGRHHQHGTGSQED